MFDISSFIEISNRQIEAGNVQEAQLTLANGLQHYTEQILKSIVPYPKEDSCLIALALNHIVNEIERNNPGAKEIGETIKEVIKFPSLEVN